MSHIVRHYYLQHLLRREVTELFLSVSIQWFAISLFSLFEPLLFWSVGMSIQRILLFYLLIYVGYFFTAPLGGKLAVRLGFEHCIAYSFASIYGILLAYFLLPRFSWMFWVAIPLVILYKTLFWIAYNANFSHYGNRKAFGKEVGFLATVVSGISIVGPLIGGYVLNWFGYSTLFIIVAVLLLVALLPIFSTREVFTPGVFSYRDAMRDFFSRRQRRTVIGMIGLSTELTNVVLWPIFMYMIVDNYAGIGIIGSIGAIAGSFVVLLMGKIADIHKKSHLMHVLAPFLAVGQFVRVFLGSVYPVLLVNLYVHAARSAFDVLWISSRYEVGRQDGNVKTAVFVEQGYAITKAFLMFLLLGLSLLWPAWNIFSVAFVVSGFFVLSFIFVKR